MAFLLFAYLMYTFVKGFSTRGPRILNSQIYVWQVLKILEPFVFLTQL
jgi:hypothetical protein